MTTASVLNFLFYRNKLWQCHLDMGNFISVTVLCLTDCFVSHHHTYNLGFWFFFNFCSFILLSMPSFNSLTILILFIYLFIYFLAVLGLRFVRGLSLAAASGGHSSSRCRDRSSSRCAGLSLSRPLPLRGTGSRRAGSASVAHGPSRSAARGILPDQGSNPCLLH